MFEFPGIDGVMTMGGLVMLFAEEVSTGTSVITALSGFLAALPISAVLAYFARRDRNRVLEENAKAKNAATTAETERDLLREQTKYLFGESNRVIKKLQDQQSTTQSYVADLEKQIFDWHERYLTARSESTMEAASLKTRVGILEEHLRMANERIAELLKQLKGSS